MQTFDTHFGPAARQTPPRVVRVLLCRSHDYLTFAGECSCPASASYSKFAVIGTDYGILRRTDGDPRFWRSASGARHALRRYSETHGDDPLDRCRCGAPANNDQGRCMNCGGAIDSLSYPQP